VRITQAEKAETRRRILSAAGSLFGRTGWRAVTTRDIADRAGIAAGTLFNYFPTKESLAVALVAEATERGGAEFVRRRRSDARLDEDLFAFIWAGLRLLRPVRGAAEGFAGALGFSEAAAPLRDTHLETVCGLLRAHGADPDAEPMMLQLYWTMYVGIVARWAADDSHNQEDTMAVLDQALRMFTGTVRRTHEAHPRGTRSPVPAAGRRS
jgi:AcrR family transcriptional regulator